MTGTWADFVITGVRYADDGDHVAALRRHTDDGERLSPPATVDRSAAIELIRLGYDYCTAIEREDRFHRGGDVTLVNAGDDPYLRTDDTETAADNFGELPTF